MMLRSWITAPALVLLSAAAVGQDLGDRAMRLDHPNGLRLVLPEGYRAAETAQGFVVEAIDNNDRRSPVVVAITWSADGRADVGWRRRAIAPGRTARYAISRADGEGSGGDFYTLVACERVAGGALCLRQEKQAEWPVAFELWDIAARVSFAAPAL
jgi:hypothetical protein